MRALSPAAVVRLEAIADIEPVGQTHRVGGSNTDSEDQTWQIRSQ